MFYCVCEAHHLQNEKFCVDFVSEYSHIFLDVFLKLCLQLELLEMQQQTEPLGVVIPVQRSLQVPKEIPVR